MRQNVDKLNKEMADKMMELENMESQLKDVESRIQLSLRFGFILCSKSIINSLKSSLRS